MIECSNCLLWCLIMKLRWGGRINYSKSRTWIGFHSTWTSPKGNTWEYTLTKPKKQAWYYIPLCYKGKVRRVNEMET